MKNIRLLLILFVAALTSCSDYLDIVPDNIATIDYAFKDRTQSEKYLFTCYSYLPNFGNPKSDPAIMGSDELWVHAELDFYSGAVGSWYPYRIKRSQQNSNAPLVNYWNGENSGKGLYRGIRDCNIFLENIHKVGPDLISSERERWIAEVTFLKAFYHYYLLKAYGPIPLVKENIAVDAKPEDLLVYREPFEDCVEYIVSLLDEALPNLPLQILDINNELGRITQPICLAVKAELLVLAASPLFNGNSDYEDIKDGRGITLFPSTYDASKWTRAAEACKNAIDTCHLANISLYEFTNPAYAAFMSDSTRRAMSTRAVYNDKWNREIIWGSTRTGSSNDYAYLSTPFFTTTDAGNGALRPILSPTLRLVEMYYSNHGVPIDEDVMYDYSGRYEVKKSPADHNYYIQPDFETASLNMNREPRFYGNLAFDGCYWFGNGRFKDVIPGTAATESAWPVKMKKGDPTGYFSNLRYSITGYYPKKSCQIGGGLNGTSITYDQAFGSLSIMRLADLYLLYAEALNESLDAPNEEVYHYIDLVRARASLEGVVESWRKYSRLGSKPSTKDGMREIIQQERGIELAFEGKRFWDLRRWKTAINWMNQPIKGWNVEGATNVEYYNIITISPMEFTTKEYLWPIKQDEIRRNKHIVQNLGW